MSTNQTNTPSLDEIVSLTEEHLDTVEVSEDDAMEASNAAQALDQVRELFNGTPMYDLLSNAIVICDTVASKYEDT